ncbi:MAG TPA: hypothetical protein VK445_08285 [Dissulfurispiraceae bacterium]|nr:hypothetical protein [Dissulfurispiraceae bacterium]
MKRLAAMLRHITILNILLAIILAVFGFALVEPLFSATTLIPKMGQRGQMEAVRSEKKIILPLEEYLVIADQGLFYQEAWRTYLMQNQIDLDEAKGAAERKAAEERQAKNALQVAVPPMQDYLAIADRNLFHPERKIPPLVKDDQVPRPEFVLYGTLITDTMSIAYLVDKKAIRSTPGRGQRQNSVKLGESLGGYQLKDVQHDRIVMVRGDDRIEVKVIAPGVKKDRGEGTASSPTARPGTPIPSAPQPALGGTPAPTAPMVTPPQQTVPMTPTAPNPGTIRQGTTTRRTFTPSNP